MYQFYKKSVVHYARGLEGQEGLFVGSQVDVSGYNSTCTGVALACYGVVLAILQYVVPAH